MKTVGYGIQIENTGNPDVMLWRPIELGKPAPGYVQIRHHAIGVNFIDIYFRTGLYKQPLPGSLGMEGAGIVEAVGADVHNIKPGDRVAYAGSPNGAYAEVRHISAHLLLKLPQGIAFEQAAAMMLKGLTVQYLFNHSYSLQSGQTIVLHAAAGGVGLLACQWAKAIGVTVIGTVSNAEKAKLAQANGCTHTVISGQDNLLEVVKDVTQGQGVAVVYDSIGKNTFETSLNCLSPLGLLVSFGNASGPIPPVDLGILASKGSLKLTRPTLMTFTERRPWLENMAEDLFTRVINKQIHIHIHQRYPLKDAAKAHTDLENRRTTGSSILIP